MPPSACRTSQSTVIVRSPSLARSTTPRSERPISRWISCVRPPILPRADSRSLRSLVARGSIEYSAVTQPVPLPRRWGGTRSAMVAAHSTSVSPTLMTHEPSAHFWTSSVKLTGRISRGPRPPERSGPGRFPMVMTSFPLPWRCPTGYRVRRSRGRAGRPPARPPGARRSRTGAGTSRSRRAWRPRPRRPGGGRR